MDEKFTLMNETTITLGDKEVKAVLMPESRGFTTQEMIDNMLNMVKGFNYELPDIDFDEYDISDLISDGVPMNDGPVFYGDAVILYAGRNFETNTSTPFLKIELNDGNENKYFSYTFDTKTNVDEVVAEYPYIEAMIEKLYWVLCKYESLTKVIRAKYSTYNATRAVEQLDSVGEDIDRLLKSINDITV